MSGLETYKSRLDQDAWRVFENTLEESRRQGQTNISSEHLIKQLLIADEGLFRKILKRLDVNLEAFSEHLEQRILKGRQPPDADIHVDVAAINVFKHAWRKALAAGRTKISKADLLLAMSLDQTGSLAEILRVMNANSGNLLEAVRTAIGREPGTDLQPVGNTPSVYREGDTVRITAGAFSTMVAKVVGVDYDKSVVKVIVNLYGRSDAIELGFSEVEKISFV